MSCIMCHAIPTLSEEGVLLLYKNNDPEAIEAQLTNLAVSFVREDKLVKCEYSSLTQLEEMIMNLKNYFKNEKKGHIQGTWTSNDAHVYPNMVSLEELAERVTKRNYLKIINEGLFTQHIQPILSFETNEIFGYEFLLRPNTTDHHFYPAELFSFSRDAGLQTLLDSQARLTAIELSSTLLPKGTKRFINFLPSSIYDPSHCLKTTFKAVEKYNVDPNDFVFEVVETEKIESIKHLQKILSVYQEHGMKVALDDLGSGYATLDVLRELKPNYAKIDRKLIDHCDQDRNKQAKLKAINEYAKAYKVTLLAEGIERKEELEYCRYLGIPLAQGYYIGKPAPSPLREKAIKG
ncbi:EAL domain-containing protein [Bacillus alkalicellulosilyticus]|uniref:EAL domain-containing protein n=1 Tax=Alkalihalobacterium alkalicellulosilyticum TaxID=1912214 RepID=UPI00099895BD|nr:EAL domain-containing protein [Bacillus alkalicellulosilyticus]